MTNANTITTPRFRSNWTSEMINHLEAEKARLGADQFNAILAHEHDDTAVLDICQSWGDWRKQYAPEHVVAYFLKGEQLAHAQMVISMWAMHEEEDQD